MLFPKTQYVRSQKLMKAYRLIPCQLCGCDDGTVCGAHSNQQRDGKGRGIKASDDRCASLCYRCHHNIDQGSVLEKHQRAQLWEKAHQNTVNALLRAGLWPQEIPVPDTRRFYA